MGLENIFEGQLMIFTPYLVNSYKILAGKKMKLLGGGIGSNLEAEKLSAISFFAQEMKAALKLSSRCTKV